MSGIVQISEAASLALHSMALIARSGDTYLSVKEIASATAASENHLSKVMQRLSKAGLVNSVRGPKGGFHLAKKADQISFLDVYTAIEGEMDMSTCPLKRPICPLDSCMFGDLIQKTTKEFKDYFEKKKLSDYIEKK